MALTLLHYGSTLPARDILMLRALTNAARISRLPSLTSAFVPDLLDNTFSLDTSWFKLLDQTGLEGILSEWLTWWLPLIVNELNFMVFLDYPMYHHFILDSIYVWHFSYNKNERKIREYYAQPSVFLIDWDLSWFTLNYFIPSSDLSPSKVQERRAAHISFRYKLQFLELLIMDVMNSRHPCYFSASDFPDDPPLPHTNFPVLFLSFKDSLLDSIIISWSKRLNKDVSDFPSRQAFLSLPVWSFLPDSSQRP
ncbi:hypothetical protein C1645_816248 [Glomus cerebriforme]|uniref:Uncharacterized protein n=1 Tax=Glomus cerebriforme TaxID=658196 RepID=A0A397TLB7_9GLOM|nr:hypothetical protein C1645_816248 [Glomus cerebriforme]